MTHGSSRASRRLLAWLERGLPPEVLADGDSRRRALLIAGTIWTAVAAALASLPAIASTTVGPGRVASLAAVIATALATMTLALAGRSLLRRRRVLAAGHVVTATLFAAIVLAAATSGGASSPCWIALAVVPMIAAQTAGRLALHAWSGLCIAVVVGLSVHGPTGFTLAGLVALFVAQLLADLGERARSEAVARAADVSARLARAEQEVERAHALARQTAATSAAKSAFLATMSHELRTPLNAVIGYAELLVEDAQGRGLPHMRDDLVRIVAAAQHLRHLLEDILDLSRDEAERPQPRGAPFSAQELVYDVTCALEPLARRRKNVLEVAFDGAPAVAELDRDRVRQILVYLVDNALTFTAQGRVTVRVRAEDDGPRRVLVIVVEDTGLGIAEVDQARIFEPRSHDSSAGLGLSLCKQLVASIGGTIAVHSELGRGSSFTVRLPAGPSAPAAPTALDVAC